MEKSDLAALEYVTRFKTGRRNVAQMMSSTSSGDDVFDLTRRFLKERKELEDARIKAGRQASPMQARAGLVREGEHAV